MDSKYQMTKINWKDESKNLTKLYPRQIDNDDPEDIADPGSFFNFFELKEDPAGVRSNIEQKVHGD
jgi:template-activating factor I